MIQCEGAGGRGCPRLWEGACAPAGSRPRSRAPGCAHPEPRPAAPKGLVPQTRMRVRARRGAQGAGCGALPAGLGPRGDARPRCRKDTQARRGAQVPRAGTRVPLPAAAPPARSSSHPRPRLCPRRARAHPGGARAPRAPLTRAWARPPPRPRLRRALSLQAGARRATICCKDGKARARGGLARGAGRDPPRRARAAAGRVLPTLCTGGGRRGALGSNRSSERGGREGGGGGSLVRRTEGGGSGRGGRCAAQGPRGSGATHPVRALLFPGRAGVPALPGLALPPKGTGRVGVGGDGNWGTMAPMSAETAP